MPRNTKKSSTTPKLGRTTREDRNDMESERQMKLAVDIMRQDRKILKALAK